MRWPVCFAVVGMMLLASESGAARKIQASVFERAAFRTLRSTMRDAGGRVDDLGPEFRNGLRNLDYLDRLRRDHDVPVEYSENLNELSALLDETNRRELGPAERAEILREIAADLETKAQCARKRLNPEDDPPPFDPVAVDARTLATGSEVSGFEVHYVLRGWARYGKHERFAPLSSPSRKSLPPGNYLLWAVRNGAKGAEARIDLGRDGELKVTVDLVTP